VIQGEKIENAEQRIKWFMVHTGKIGRITGIRKKKHGQLPKDFKFDGF